jgi:hypothetical protein
MRIAETINPVPYSIEVIRDGDAVVEVSITAVEGQELGPAQIRAAMNAVLDHMRPAGEPAAVFAGTLQREQMRRRYRQQMEEASELPQMKALADAYEAGAGRVTDLYLAQLAVVYAELAPQHRNVSMRIATALSKPLQTIKGHLMRARKEGYLSETVEGREGGQATKKALDILKG